MMARLFNDAASEYLQYAGAVVSGPPCTLACWMRSDDAAAAQALVYLARSSSDTPLFGIDASGNIAGDPVRAVQRDDANVTGAASSTTGFSANTWHHVCGVFTSNSSRTIYLDGGSNATNTTVCGTTTLDRTAFGRIPRLTPTAYFSGRGAELAIWDVALSAAEVAALARRISPRRLRSANLVTYWPVYGTASPEVDHAGNGFNLTVTGTTQADHYGVMAPLQGFDGWLGAFTAAGAAAAEYSGRGIGRGIARGVMR